MSEIDEFREISSLILKPHLSLEELNELARRWADNSLRIQARHGLNRSIAASRELVEEHREKIIRLRRRLGLDVPEV